MNTHFRSLCILGAVAAFGLWNCEDSTGATDSIKEQINEAEQQLTSSSSEDISSSAVETATSSDSESIADSSAIDNIALSSSAELIVSSSSVEQIATFSSSVEAAVSSNAENIVSSSSEAVIASSSSEEAVVSTVKKSAGCGKNLNGLATGYRQITSSGKTRDYAIDIPTNYDPNKPYKLFYTSHWYGGSMKDVVNGTVTNGGAANWSFYGLKRMATEAGEQAIFIAPSMSGSTWDLSGTGADHALFNDLMSFAKDNLCVDEDRVFAVGFSFGAMMTYSLSLTHQDELRAVATLASTNYVGSASSPWIPYPADSKKKIAYLGITGMSDGTCPFIGDASKKLGGLYVATLHAEDNGCTVPSDPTTIDKTYAGSKTHVIYDFKNCAEGYPVKYATFDGGHIAAPTDGQTSNDGLKTWAPKLMWDFFAQF